MFRRVLMLWLIVSVFGYGMALAADVHGNALSDPAHEVVGHPGALDAGGASPGCDHCCHGLAHLLGLGGTQALSFLPLQYLPETPSAVHFCSFVPPSLLRPPIAA